MDICVDSWKKWSQCCWMMVQVHIASQRSRTLTRTFRVVWVIQRRHCHTRLVSPALPYYANCEALSLLFVWHSALVWDTVVRCNLPMINDWVTSKSHHQVCWCCTHWNWMNVVQKHRIVDQQYGCETWLFPVTGHWQVVSSVKNRSSIFYFPQHNSINLDLNLQSWALLGTVGH